jgi:hypothetical protein
VWRGALRIVLALVAAAATSATVCTAANAAFLLLSPAAADSLGFIAETSSFVWPIAFVVALAHGIVLGLPAYLLIRALGWPRWWVNVAGGFTVGSVPFAVLALRWSTPPPPGLVEAKVIAPFSWLQYGSMTAGLGILGMAGGCAAWLAWSGLGRRFAKRDGVLPVRPG